MTRTGSDDHPSRDAGSIADGFALRAVRHEPRGRSGVMRGRKLLVLVVESERQLATFYQLELLRQGHHVNLVHSAEHALEVLDPSYDVVVTDLRLPRMSGEEFIRSVRARAGCADLPVLVIASESTLPGAIDDGVTRLRRKPFDLHDFASHVTEAAGMGRFRN